MTNFVGNNVSSGNIIYANDHNELVNRIAAVVNGGLDDTNIGSLSGSKVNSGSLPAAALAASVNPNTLLGETIKPFVQTGCIWSTVSGLNGTMSSGTTYASHANAIYRVTVSSITSHGFTASKDTYIDIDYNGNITYNEVANGASAPALTADAVRVAKVVTGSSAITGITQTGIDSNNVQIYPISPAGFGNWPSWSPVFTNITVGNGSLRGNYTQVGKTVIGRAIFQSGSTTAYTGGGTTYQITLPVAANVPGLLQKAGRFTMYESSTGFIYEGIMQLADTGHAYLLVLQSQGAGAFAKYVTITSSNFTPSSSGSGSYWEFNFQYEAA